MSTPPQGRALSFPIIWNKDEVCSVDRPQTSIARSPTDEEVMGRILANDSGALTFLFDRYSRLVLSIAARILRDHGEAEDVVQDTFIYVYLKASLFDPTKGTVKGWIARIALHRALDRKSYLGRRSFYSNGTEAKSLCDTLMSDANLEQEFGAKLNRVQLEKAFEELPIMQRRTLELFYFEGLELREITEELAESFGNVRHHFYRGLERLRKSAFVQTLREK